MKIKYWTAAAWLMVCACGGDGGGNGVDGDAGEDGDTGNGQFDLPHPQTLTVLSAVAGGCAGSFGAGLAEGVSLRIDGEAYPRGDGDSAQFGTGSTYVTEGSHEVELGHNWSGCEGTFYADTIQVSREKAHALFIAGEQFSERVTQVELGSLRGDGTQVLFVNLSNNAQLATFSRDGEYWDLLNDEWRLVDAEVGDTVEVTTDELAAPLSAEIPSGLIANERYDYFRIHVCFIATDEAFQDRLHCTVHTLAGNETGWL